ncbi:MAG: regulatory protein GemA [Gammaproteobacteria bacterium]|nr:regulatory protein GemA [Gammaproteobacteria bacterium]
MNGHTDIWLHRNRRIWASAHEVGLEEDELRDVVESVTTKRSISGLTEFQQTIVIRTLDRLKKDTQKKRRRQKKRISGKSGDQATSRQIGEMRRLSEALGWGRPALRAWLKRCFSAEREEWLSANRASAAIQGLKTMVSRKGSAAAE